jgi:hypothetical protein
MSVPRATNTVSCTQSSQIARRRFRGKLCQVSVAMPYDVQDYPVARIKAADRDRLDLRAEPAWIARVRRQADRFGMSISAYIRAKTTEALEKDEATDEPLKGRKTRP